MKEWWPQVLDGVGRAVGFDASKPVDKLTAKQMDAVWSGLPENMNGKPHSAVPLPSFAPTRK